MASTITADNGVSSGSAGLKSSADSSGVLALASGTGTTAVTIDASQNVGIGTSSFDANWSPKLQVVSAASDGSGGILIESYRPSLIFKDDSASAVRQHIVADSSALIFGSGDASFTERARIDSSGNLLVGTTTNVASNGKLAASQAGTGNVGAAISADATDANYTYSIAYFNSSRAASSAFNFIKCTSGNYGVTQFQVTGNGVIYAQNTTVQSLSDIRTKENVRDSEDGLQVIMGVRPVRFDFKEGFGNDRKNVLGFIAQEIESVFPDAVDVSPVDPDGEGPEEPYKSVGPASLIPVLVKAIQEQQALITTLTERITALEAK